MSAELAGQMMSQPLLISSLIDHAERYHGSTKVVSVETNGKTARKTWKDIATGARRLASALEGAGFKSGPGAQPLRGTISAIWKSILVSVEAV